MEDNVIQKDSCDNIILFDGKEILGKVIEITENTIKYKRCSYLEGPLLTINKSKIILIQYANGSKELFNVRIDYSHKPGWMSIISFVSALLMLFPQTIFFRGICTIIALLFGISGFSNRYRILAILGIIGGVLGLVTLTTMI